jgi:hypothetical protein
VSAARSTWAKSDDTITRADAVPPSWGAMPLNPPHPSATPVGNETPGALWDRHFSAPHAPPAPSRPAQPTLPPDVAPPMLASDDPMMSFDPAVPPTDEMVGFDDQLAPSYGAPTQLGDASPFGSLEERFTPVSVERTVGDRPTYEPAPVAATGRDEAVLPLPLGGSETTMPPDDSARPAAPRSQPEAPRPAPPKGNGVKIALLGLLAASIGAIGMLVLVGLPMLTSSGSSSSATQVVSVPPSPAPAPVVAAEPEPAPVDDEALAEADASGIEVEPAAPSTPEAAPRTEPSIKVHRSGQTEPVASATPSVGRPTTAKAAPKDASVGILRIRSNRRVLVKVNGQAKEYSPLDLELAPGSYQVSAALPGRPETEQSLTVELAGGATEPVSFSF